MGNPVGNEIIKAQGIAANGQPAAAIEEFTLQQVANLANTEDSSLSETIVNTNVGTILSGAALVSGQIARQGPTAAFTDTTDSAANILAALPGFVSGSTFLVRIKNTTAFQETLAAGANITLPQNIYIPNQSVGNYFGKIGGSVAAPTVVFTHMSTVPIIEEFAPLLTPAVPIVSTTTLTNIAGMAVSLLTSGVYYVLAELPVTANAAGGTQLALAASNNLTATSFSLIGKFFTALGVVANGTTTLGSSVGTTTATVLAELEGIIAVNTGGTLTLQAAQNVATTATTTLLANGFMLVKRIS